MLDAYGGFSIKLGTFRTGDTAPGCTRCDCAAACDNARRNRIVGGNGEYIIKRFNTIHFSYRS